MATPMQDRTSERFRAERASMVASQIEGRGIRDPLVLQAMRAVPREAFVAEALHAFAYDDTPLPIEHSQTISQPYIVASTLEAAQLYPGCRVLEVGAGSGYAAAVIAAMGCRVNAIERIEALADGARERLSRSGYPQVIVKAGDGTLGWPDAAPFDAIVAAAAGPRIPEPWRQQLAVGGRIVMPRGAPGSQRLVKLIQTGPGAFQEQDLGAVSFVPLIGMHGCAE